MRIILSILLQLRRHLLSKSIKLALVAVDIGQSCFWFQVPSKPRSEDQIPISLLAKFGYSKMPQTMGSKTMQSPRLTPVSFLAQSIKSLRDALASPLALESTLSPYPLVPLSRQAYPLSERNLTATSGTLGRSGSRTIQSFIRCFL